MGRAAPRRSSGATVYCGAMKRAGAFLPAALWAVAAAFGAAGASGAQGGAAPPPNLLLVTLDTTRADHLGAWGYAGARTPNLDRLAAGGTRFERCDASAPICSGGFCST